MEHTTKTAQPKTVIQATDPQHPTHVLQTVDGALNLTNVILNARVDELPTTLLIVNVADHEGTRDALTALQAEYNKFTKLYKVYTTEVETMLAKHHEPKGEDHG